MRRVTALLLFVCSLSVHAEVRFNGPDLSADNRLLFRASVDAPGYGVYDTLFLSDLESGTIRQITYYPEELVLIKDNERVQIQNRFGTFRTDTELSGMGPAGDAPSFVNGGIIESGKVSISEASPDGRYLLFLVPTSYGYSRLTLYDAETDSSIIVTSDTELSLEGPRAKWSPNSRYFIYAKKGTLYYYSIDQVRGERILAENYRAVGNGQISSIQWTPDNNLYYLSGSMVYRIFSAELFTRSLYSDLLAVGDVIGKIPFSFNPHFDDFWIAPDGRRILLSKGGRNIFLYFLQADDFLSIGETMSLPYLFLPRNTRLSRVVWPAGDMVTVIAGSIVSGERSSILFRLDLAAAGGALFFHEAARDIRDAALSPDSRKAAVLTSDGVEIRDYETWELIRNIAHPEPLHAVWRDSGQIVIGGAHYTEVVTLSGGEGEIMSLSQAGTYGFSVLTGMPQVRLGDRVFEVNEDGSVTEIEETGVSTASTASSAYRVYIEETLSGTYSNKVMVRRIDGFGTYPLFQPPEFRYEPYPESEQPVDPRNFSHGSRIRGREVSLVFNAIDSDEGLTEILNALSEYGVRGTFFLNGEFIRRHPGAVKEIAESGHEVGSLFFVNFDMTDSRYKVDTDFIRRGLARNEDDYFNATGRELSLMWHAPYYVINRDILEAAEGMSYIHVGRDLDPLDWVTPADVVTTGMYMPASALVERVLRLKKPGSIIPIRVGETDPGREDYLFNHVDILIDALLDLGYSVVPVSVLMENAR